MVEPPGEPPKESPKGMGLRSGDSCTLIQKWAGPGGECSLHFEKSPAEEASAVGSSFCRKLLLKEVPFEGNPFQGKSLVRGESRLRRCRPAGLVRRAVETLYPPWSCPPARAHWHSEGCSLGLKATRWAGGAVTRKGRLLQRDPVERVFEASLRLGIASTVKHLCSKEHHSCDGRVLLP